MPRQLPFRPFLLLIAIMTATASAQNFDNASFIGGGAGFHLRQGTLFLDDNHHEDIGKPAMLTGGFIIGKRWGLLPALRLQLSADINYGSAVDDTLDSLLLEDGSSVETIITSTFWYGGIVADFQAPFDVAPGCAWYVHAGGGVHLVYMSESESTLENTPRLVANDPYPVTVLSVSPSVQAGLGFELQLSPHLGFGVAYTARYWYPVHYGMQRDLFPYDPQHYHERFFSHELDLLLLVKKQ